MIMDLVVTFVCLVASACFSGFENGIIAVRQARLDHACEKGESTAHLIRRFLARPGLLMATVLLGNNLTNVFAPIYWDRFCRSLVSDDPSFALVPAAVLTFVLLICGEIVPKSWFRQRPFERVSLLIYPMFLFQLVFYPVIALMAGIEKLLRRFAPAGTDTESTGALREEFRLMLLESSEAELLDAEAYALLDNALDYHSRRVSHTMVPLSDVARVAAGATLAEAVAISRQVGRSRLPVYREGPGGRELVGVFSVYDALFRVAREQWEQERVLDYVRPLVAIRADAPVADVLAIARRHRSPLLIVLDRRQQPCGIITQADAILSLFGEFSEFAPRGSRRRGGRRREGSAGTGRYRRNS